MTFVRHFIAAAVIVTPVVASAQDAARIGQKQKSWMVSNFRSGLTCSATPGGSAVSFSGEASFDASGDGGVDISVSPGDGGLPTITAHAIKTKGAGGVDRGMAPQSCPSGASAGSSAAACSVSGDVQSPVVHFTVPLSAFGDAATSKNYVGTVTIVKRASGPSLIGMWLSKKGYDYYAARSDMGAAGAVAHPGMLVIASCDSSKVTAKGKPMIATYDLATLKK